MNLDSPVFALNNSFAIKIKKKLMDTWHKIVLPIEIQFRIYLDLDFLIFAFNNSLGTKKKKEKKKERTNGAQLDCN